MYQQGYRPPQQPQQQPPRVRRSDRSVRYDTRLDKKKHSVLLLIAGILGVAYAIYIISYMSSAGSGMSSSDSAQAVGTAIAMSLITPHAALASLAALFNVIGWAMNARWAALVAGILYSVAAVMMFMYAPFVAVQLILCFVAFAKMKKA